MKSPFFIHAHLLPPLLDILLVGLVHFWAWRRINQLCWTPLLSRAVSCEILPSTSLNQGCDSAAFCLVSSAQDPELCHPMIITAKAALDLHIPDWLFLSMRSRRVSSLFDFQFSCAGMLSLMPSWMVFHTVSPLQQISGSENLRFLPVIWRTPVVQAIPHPSKTMPADAHRPLFLLFFTLQVVLYSSSERHSDVLISQKVYEIFPHVPERHYQQSEAEKKTWIISNVCNFPGLLQIQKVISPWHIG